jgi:hypothetical protein
LYNVSVVKIQNVIGKPVTDGNFFGREKELADLLDVTPREHVLMLAPRRVGKTSLLRALGGAVDRSRASFSVYASVGSATTEAEFVQAVLEAIYATDRGKKLRPNIIRRAWRRRRTVKKVNVGPAGLEFEHERMQWQQPADEAFARVFKTDLPILIMIDELPILVLALAAQDPSGIRVRAFLQWFRHLRQRPEAEKLRFVLAGSIGLDNVTRRHQLTETINDLRVWRLGPFDPTTADVFLSELATSYQVDLSDEVRKAVCGIAEWLIPYHLQVIFNAVRSHANGAKPSREMLDAVTEKVLNDKNYFSHWDERLVGALGKPADDIARAMLMVCARDPAGATHSTLLQTVGTLVPEVSRRESELTWIREILVNDGYLVDEDGRWRFRSGLLRRFWLSQTR